MFKKLTKFIVSELDPRRELVPVESLADNEHFRPLCLLIKKRKSSRIFHPAPYYQHTGLTLDDVLEPGKEDKHIEATHQDSSQFTLTKISADQADAGLSITADAKSVGLQGGASSSNVFSIKPQKNSITLKSLEALSRERKMNKNHSFIRQLQKTGLELHVVTEILEASEEAVYREYTKADGSFMAKLYATFFAKGNRKNAQVIVIPKGCTLAFRTIPLHIRNGEWSLNYFPNEVMQIRYLQVASGKKIVEREVKYSCRIFPKLSPDLQLIILNTIKAVMRDKNLLQELSQKMEEVLEQNDGYELKTESPDLKALFNTLKHSPRDRLLLLAEGITYVLDALHELMEDQLRLLLESLEKKIVSQQLNLVENLLHDDLKFGMSHFHLDPVLLSFPHEEEQKLTIALVELGGVELQANGSFMSWGKSFEAVAALFVALYILNLLSGSK